MKISNSFVKILLFGSGGCFFIAVIVYFFMISYIIAPSLFFNIIDLYSVIFDFGSVIFGFIIIIFFIIFVATIFVMSQLQTENDNKNKYFIYNFAKRVLIINAVIAFVWFAVVKGQIEGDFQGNENNYFVTYRGEFVKNITNEQFYEFEKKNMNSTAYLIPSVFILFTGGIFFTLLEANKMLEDKI